MSTTSYGDRRKLKLVTATDGHLTGSYVTGVTAKKTTTLKNGLTHYFRVGYGDAGTSSDGTTAPNGGTASGVASYQNSVVRRKGNTPFSKIRPNYDGYLLSLIHI